MEELLIDTGTTFRTVRSTRIRVYGIMRKRNSPLNSTFEILIAIGSGGTIDIQAGGVVARDTVWLEGTVLLADTSSLIASDPLDFQTTGRVVGTCRIGFSSS